jgi:hypothetical protein
MTSTSARSGMPEHFGIRITEADKDRLVGELDVDDRHLNNSGHVHGGALAAFADDLGGRLAGLNVPPGFRDNYDRIEDEYLSGLRARAADRHCRAGPCGAAHDRPANLDIPPGRKACRNDDSDSDGASSWVGYACG